MNYFCFSDIHGQKKLFDKIMEFLNSQTEEWRCIFLGDAVDRGEHGYEIMETILNDNRFYYIRGNHEAMFCAAARAMKKFWYYHGVEVPSHCDLEEAREYYSYTYYIEEVNLHVANGGSKTLLDWICHGARTDIIHKVAKLPDTMDIEINGKTFAISHAGYDPDDLTTDPLWSRDHFYKPYDYGIMIHGHTPVYFMIDEYGINSSEIMGEKEKTHPLFYQNGTKIDVDTGCFFTDVINVINLNTMEVHRFEDNTFHNREE